MKKQLFVLACFAFTAIAAMGQTQSDAAEQTRQADLQTWKGTQSTGSGFQ